MKTIHGLAALIAISAASSLMACAADPGSNDDTTATDEARVAESASAISIVRTMGPRGGFISVYVGPGTTFGVAYTIRPGTYVVITCYTRGEFFEGSNLWYRLNNGYWIPDGHVLTGTRAATQPPCGAE